VSIDETTNTESEKILQEAAAVAENTVIDKLPSTPVESISPSSSTRFM